LGGAEQVVRQALRLRARSFAGPTRSPTASDSSRRRPS
jgi:hypothetical protein